MVFISKIKYHFKSISKYQTYQSFEKHIHFIQFKIPFQFTFQNSSIPNKLLHLNHKKIKLLHLIIKLLNFQNFQLPKFIYSLKFIKTVKIHFSWHLENATERYIQNSSI